MSDDVERLKKKEQEASNMIVDEVEFYNAGTVPDPYPAVLIEGRDEGEWSKDVKLRIGGNVAENFQNEVESGLVDSIKYVRNQKESQKADKVG